MLDRSGKNGLFNLHRFLRPSILQKTLVQIKPVVPTQASAHLHAHNIYFKKPSEALRRSAQLRSDFKQLITPSVLIKLKIVEPTDHMIGQLSCQCHTNLALCFTNDRIAGANVMTYYNGYALNWHFDQSEFTTTLPL